jgi:DNA-binding SARP family transcriptional activator
MVYGLGDDEAVLRYCEELTKLSRKVGGDALAESYARGVSGLMAMFRGDFEAARELLEEALPLFREAGEDGMAAQTHSWLGTVLLLQGNHEGARRRFEEGSALGEILGDRVSVCNALFNLAQLALARGDHHAAFDRFAQGVAPSQELGDRGNIAYILEGLGIVAGARGEALRAARLLGASEALIKAIGLGGHTYYRLDRSLYEIIDVGVRATLDEASFEATLDEGRAMTLEEAIEYALGAGQESAADPPPMAPVPERTLSGQKPVETAEAKATTAELCIFALGLARVAKEGRPLDSSPDWIQKPRELLYYLLSHPSRTREQTGLVLWPEASADQLRSSFHDTVYRLRRALGGKEWIVFEKGRYAFNRSLDYFFDVEAFEENLSEARRVQAEAPEQAIRHLQKATDLYGGDFLEGLAYSEWVVVRQEELQRAYGEALLLLGGLLFTQDRYAEAAEAYREAIAHDELLEEAHRELMRCYVAMGERGRALVHYEDLVELLNKQLGTAPAPETSALHERLRNGEEV